MQHRFLFIHLFAAFLLTACSQESSGPQITGSTMGTSYSIQWSELPSDVSTAELSEKISLRLGQINTLMSTYIPDSQISEFNSSRETGWHAVDIELVQLVEHALEICAITNGAFDITVGPLVNLWGFGASDTNFQIPNESEINIAMRSIGCHHLGTRMSPPAINKKLADVYIDLSAIAKGYAVDELVKLLEEYRLQHYMVEIGGEVRARGIAPHGHPWRIGIETPDSLRGSIEDIISLDNIAVATSGDYRNFFEHEGQRYSHTIDPRTGYPVNHQLASVTIIHPSTASADAWATAFMILGANDSLEVAKHYGFSGLLITRHGNDYHSTVFGEMSSYLTQ